MQELLYRLDGVPYLVKLESFDGTGIAFGVVGAERRQQLEDLLLDRRILRV